MSMESIYESEQGFKEVDWHKMSEKWRDQNGDLTFRINYPLSKDSFVMDVGGYVGDWAQDIYCKYGCDMIVYEPIPEFYHTIRHKFSDNSSVTVLDYGLSHENVEEAPMSMLDEGTSLLYTAADENNEKVVRLRSIVDEMRELGRDVDLLKINIEGAEYGLLEKMIDENLVDGIANIQIQFHIFVKHYEYRRDEIRKALSKTHELTYDFPFIWENWRRKARPEETLPVIIKVGAPLPDPLPESESESESEEN